MWHRLSTGVVQHWLYAPPPHDQRNLALGHLQQPHPCASKECIRLVAAAPRAVPSVPALQRLEGVGNARDFAEACSRIAPGKMFRSANPISATREDVAILRQQLGICELVSRNKAAAGPPTCRSQYCCSLAGFADHAASIMSLVCAGDLLLIRWHILFLKVALMSTFVLLLQIDLRSRLERREDQPGLLLQDAIVRDVRQQGRLFRVRLCSTHCGKLCLYGLAASPPAASVCSRAP